MAKNYKIKRYDSMFRSSGDRRMRWVKGVAAVGVAVLLFLLGWLIYDPVYRYLTDRPQQPEEMHSSQSEAPGPAPEQNTGEQQQEPEPEKVETTDAALYLPASVFQDRARLETALAQAKTLELDTVLLELKDADGILHYRSGVPAAAEIGAVAPDAVDLQALSEQISAAGLHFGARLYALRDPQAAMYRKAWAVKYQNTDYNWLDNAASAGGKPWLNPYSEQAQEYILDLVRELSAAGCSEFVLEGVQFPDGYLQEATYPGANGQPGSEALRSFSQALQEAAGVPVSFAVAPAALLGGNLEQSGGMAPREIFPALCVTMIADALPESVLAGDTVVAVQQEPAALLAQMQAAAGEKPLRFYVSAADVQAFEQLRGVLEAGQAADWILYDPSGDYSFVS